MTGTKTGEEVRKENEAAMGRELGALFNVLSVELTWAYWRWHQYVKLFASEKKRLDLLNSSASFFFYVIQETLWHETLLGISRLAGPEKTAGKQNLSVRQLIQLLSDHALKTKAEQLLDKVKAAAAFALVWRNRHIAHRDLDISLGTTATPLPDATREKVDAALKSLAELLNGIQVHFDGSTTAYEFDAVDNDADRLLYVLRDGLRREELRLKKLEAGEYNPEDWDES